MLNFIIGFVIGGAVVYFFLFMMQGDKRDDSPNLPAEKFNNDDEERKVKNIAKVKDFIADNDKFTNDDLQNLLGVSDTTIGRYLKELEADGTIVQVGETGSGVYYTKK